MPGARLHRGCTLLQIALPGFPGPVTPSPKTELAGIASFLRVAERRLQAGVGGRPGTGLHEGAHRLRSGYPRRQGALGRGPGAGYRGPARARRPLTAGAGEVEHHDLGGGEEYAEPSTSPQTATLSTPDARRQSAPRNVSRTSGGRRRVRTLFRGRHL